MCLRILSRRPHSSGWRSRRKSPTSLPFLCSEEASWVTGEELIVARRVHIQVVMGTGGQQGLQERVEDNMRLKDKVAVVTGGSRGLGKAIARRFLEEGAVVVITATKEDKLRKTAEELSELGRVEGVLLKWFPGSATSRMRMKSIIERYGQVDILVNQRRDHGGFAAGQYDGGSV